MVKNKKLLFILFALLVFGGILLWICREPVNKSGNHNFVDNNENIGTFDNKETSSGFGNDQIEKAIIDYLLTQKQFAWKTQENSNNFCSIENLDPKKELFPLYVWVYCAEYSLENGELETLSGSSGPVKIVYPNELSFYDLDRFSHEVPRNGSYYSEDIKEIFPENIQEKIFNFDPKNIIKKNETAAFAEVPTK